MPGVLRGNVIRSSPITQNIPMSHTRLYICGHRQENAWQRREAKLISGLQAAASGAHSQLCTPI